MAVFVAEFQMAETVEEQLAAMRADLRLLMERVTRILPTAMSRARAAEELDISGSKLKEWIADGRILTCEDPSLIPSSEVLRVSRPVRHKKRAPRPSGYRRKQREAAYSPTSEAEKAKHLRKR